MKKINLLIATTLFVAGVSSMQAQGVVKAKLGFEPGEEREPTKYALTPNIGNKFGDWVNFKDTDSWGVTKDDAHSGEYSFCAMNTGAVANTWDRGFKIGVPDVKLETPYRVSFWVKIDPTCVNPETGEEIATQLTAWMSKGVENLDKSFCSPSRSKDYGFNKVDGFTGEWQRMTFVTFNPKAEVLNKWLADTSWAGTAVFPSQFGGDGSTTYRQFFDEQVPELYFFIANMFCPATYYLDDILVEEGVAVKEVTYSEEIIRINFGWDNNIAALAKENNGTVIVNKSLAKVTQNGEEVPVNSIEGKEDGYLYIFVDASLSDDDEVVVDFAGDERIVYTAEARPSSDTEGTVAVLPFAQERGIYDESVDAEALAWSDPTIETSVPANNSFNLLPEEVKEITITFAAEVGVVANVTKAELKNGGKTTDVSAGMKLSDDKKTLTILVPSVGNGKSTLSITNLKNAVGVPATAPIELTFEVGKVEGGEAVVAYQSNFGECGVNTLPLGWAGRGDDGSDREARQEFIGSGYSGAPRMMGGESAPNHGIYICQRGGSAEGLCSFGKYAAMEAVDGQLPSDISEAEALHLTPGEYTFTYKIAKWENNGGSSYMVGVYNAVGEAVMSDGTLDSPLVPESGVANADDDAKVAAKTYNFSIDEEGFYYVEFATKSGWSGLLLTDMSIVSKPESEGAYYMSQLNAAIATAEEVQASVADAAYDCADKTALAASLKKAKEDRFVTAAAVTAMVKELNEREKAMSDTKADYDKYLADLNTAETDAVTLWPGDREPAAKLLGQVPANVTLADAEAYAAAKAALATAKAEITKMKEVTDEWSANGLRRWQNLQEVSFPADEEPTLNAIIGVALNGSLDLGDEEGHDSYLDAIDNNERYASYKAYAEFRQSLGEAFKDAHFTSTVAEQDTYLKANFATSEKVEEFKLALGIKYNEKDFADKGYDKATEAAPAEITDRLINPSFAEGPVKGWTSTGGDATNNEYSYDENGHRTVAELWNRGTFTFSQVVSGLPAGTYELRAQALYRDASAVVTATAISWTGEEEWPNHNANIFIKNDKNMTTNYLKGIYALQSTENSFTLVYTAYDEEEDGIATPTAAKYMTGTLDDSEMQEGINYSSENEGAYPFDTKVDNNGVTYYYPSSMQGFYQVCRKNPEVYSNSVRFYLSEPGNLEVGIEKVKAIGGDWVIMDNFQLFYLGKAAPTGIEAIEDNVVKADGKYYNLAGQQVDANYKGIVIVNGKKILNK